MFSICDIAVRWTVARDHDVGHNGPPDFCGISLRAFIRLQVWHLTAFQTFDGGMSFILCLRYPWITVIVNGPRSVFNPLSSQI